MGLYGGSNRVLRAGRAPSSLVSSLVSYRIFVSGIQVDSLEMQIQPTTHCFGTQHVELQEFTCADGAARVHAA